MKDYHDYEELPLGGSDIAALILVGIHPLYGGLITQPIFYGGDRYYTAHFVNEEWDQVPSHYSLQASFQYWMKVYDDNKCQLHIIAGKDKDKVIEVYRAGNFGTIIYAPGAQVKTKGDTLYE